MWRMETTATLIAEADAEHAEFPQYRNHWNQWIAVRALRDIKHRGMVVVPAGDAVLMDPASVETIGRNDFDSKASARGRTFATFYLAARHRGHGCDTVLPTAGFEMP